MTPPLPSVAGGQEPVPEGLREAPNLARLLEIMQRLRGPQGCPWDREQTSATIRPYTIEEAYEVADAIDRGSPDELRDELGDLLFQVVFHAQMAHEAGRFDFDDVARAICDKLVRRHPHVFGDASARSVAEQTRSWEEIKASERAAKRQAEEQAAHDASSRGTGARADGTGVPASGERAPPSHVDGVPRALPALMRAEKISRRAARVGFDWDHFDQTADKVAEELAEVRTEARAHAEAPPREEPAGQREVDARIFEEVGDLLFAAANLARKLEVDAESALRAANDKFERRFRGMEALAARRGQVFAEMDLAGQERLWQEVKRGE